MLSSPAMAEVWFRNPQNYIRELVEVGSGNVVWDRGMLIKRRLDAYKHADAYFGSKKDWRLMLIGDQGTVELRHGRDLDNPVAVYPTWDATNEPLELLEEMMLYPLGEDAGACNDPSVSIDERPVFGQEHRVVINYLPKMTTGVGRRLLMKLKELQEDYPDCILHLHGAYSWRVMFGMGIRSADVDPRTNAGKGKVTLPNGREVFAERVVQTPQWATLLGMKPIELTREPRNRTIYNIKSAMWAGEFFMTNLAFQSTGKAPVDPDAVNHKPATSSFGHLSKPSLPVQPNDKIHCDTCSLANSCKYYRQGSVCSVPGSEPASLARHFGTRDPDTIIDGLAQLQALGARRLEQGVAQEQSFGELDPEVTKIINQLFMQGEKLAKLVDPHRFKGPSVQVNVGGQVPGIQASTPNQVIGAIVRELESRGIPREKITPEMVSNLLEEMSGGRNAPQAIEGVVLSSKEG